MTKAKKRPSLAKFGVMSALVLGLSVACVPSVVAYSTEQAEQSEVAAQQAEQPASYQKTEVVYATLSPAGALQGMYVVNQFEVSAAGAVEDFGPYSTVANLTDQGAMKHADGLTEFAAPEGSFYYQGNVEVDGAKLPWDVSIRYALDGTVMEPEELAGKSGALSVHVSTQAAEGVDRAFYDSYMLQISFTLNGDTTSDIQAEGATVASAGRNRTVAFTVLPGRDGDCTLKANVTDFEMSGIQIAALPYSMVMEMPDTSDLTGQMTELSDAVSALSENGETIAAASNEINNALGMMSAQLTPDALAALEGLPSQIGSLLPYSVKELNDIAAGIDDTIAGLKEGLSKARVQLEGLRQSGSGASQQESEGEPPSSEQNPSSDAQEIAALEYSIAEMEGMISQLEAQSRALKEQAAQLDASTPMLVGQLDGLVDLAGGVAQLSANYGAFNSGLQEYMGGIAQLNEATINIPSTMRAEIEAMMADYDFPEFSPVSFMDSRNNANMAAVQFVLTTQAIEVVEPEPEPEPEEEEQTIVDRFFALFQ